MSRKLSIEQFDGGIQRDKRSRSIGGCAFSSHFDHTVAPNKLVPRRDFESFNDLDGVTNGMSGKGLRCIGFALNGAARDVSGENINGNGTILAVGRKQTGTGCKLYATELDTTNSNTRSSQWYVAYNSGGAALETSDYYPDYGVIAGVSIGTDGYYYFPTNDGVYVGQYSDSDATLDGDIGADYRSARWDFDVGPDGNTYVTRGGRSASSSNNGIDQITSTFTEAVFYTGSYTYITSICRNANYIGIGVYDYKEGTSRQSFLHVWDTVNDDPTTVIPLGNGRVQSVAEVSGSYVMLLQENLVGSTFLSQLGNGDFSLKLLVSDGSTAREVTRIDGAAYVNTTTAGNSVYLPNKMKRADEVLIYSRVPIDTALTTFHEGLWSIRKSSTGEFALTLAYDTSSLGAVNAWHGVGNQAFFIHGTNDEVSRFNTTASYTITSYFETLINPQMPTDDYFRDKAFEAFRIKCEPLPSGATITLKYKADTETSWTTFGTVTDDNTITKEFVNIETTGNPLPDFKEIQFRIESLGGAVVTGYEYRYDVKSDIING